MNKKKRMTERFDNYLKWPLWLSPIGLVATIIIYFLNLRAGIVMTVAFAVYLAAAVFIYFYFKPNLDSELISFGMEYAQTQRSIMHHLVIPYIMVDENGKMLWVNEAVKKLLGEYVEMKNISSFVPEIKSDVFKTDDAEKKNLHIHVKDQYYRAEITRIQMDCQENGRNTLLKDVSETKLFAVYFFEETEVVQTRKEIQNQKLICGVILVDNYEEALNSTEEVRRSLLAALVEHKITKYLQNYDAIVNKMEKDKYIFVMRQKYLPMLQSSKFALLDEVREINIGNEMSVTLCIGLGVNAESYGQALEWARHAIDLALGRGGDQAVVKDRGKISYYGGKTKQVEKSTRVRARVKAHALKQVIEGKEQVVIMGHKIGDVDCIGAAIGVYRAARLLNKKAYIVLNDVTQSVQSIILPFQDNPDYDSDMFITSEQARGIVNMNTALIVVDVNISDRTEGPELLNMTKTTVVIDHHRQSGNAIENPVLSYVEPYASSACEMVAEILQYITDKVKLRPEEADALYAGMLIDTNYFMNKTGVRTFEAAAFLRKCGADITSVRLKLRDDIATYKARADAVKSAMIEGPYAYAFCPAEGVDSPTVVGAQAANELLGVTGVEASFVFTPVRDTVYISARSYETMNVQLVMERLGGGGHSTIAGAQMKDVTMQEACDKVREVIKEMKTEGDL